MNQQTTSLVFGILVLTSCGSIDHGSGGGGTERYDSAGIAVVVHHEDTSGNGVSWTLADAPTVTIGTMDGPDESILDGVIAALVMEDGRFVIGDSGNHRILVFDLDGRFLRSFGRSGSGPGEFERLGWIGRLTEDRLGAWDEVHARFTTFSPSGGVLGTTSVDDSDTHFVERLIGRLGDGSLLVRRSRATLDRRDDPQGVYRNPIHIVRVGAGANRPDTLLTVPGTEDFLFQFMKADGLRSWGGAAVIYGRDTYVTVDSDHLHVGDSGRYEIRTYDRRGRLLRIMRRMAPPRALSANDQEAERSRRREQAEGLIASSRDQHEFRMARVEATPVRDTLPYFQSLLVDDDRRLWVERARSTADLVAWWDIFSEEADHLGELRLPSDFHVLSAGREHVALRLKDEWGVERVQIYPLINSAEEELHQ